MSIQEVQEEVKRAIAALGVAWTVEKFPLKVGSFTVKGAYYLKVSSPEAYIDIEHKREVPTDRPETDTYTVRFTSTGPGKAELSEAKSQDVLTAVKTAVHRLIDSTLACRGF